MQFLECNRQTEILTIGSWGSLGYELYRISTERTSRMYTMYGSADWFLICGLGSLGQHCAMALKEFEVGIIGIDLVEPSSWEIAAVPELLDEAIWGDCRHHRVLERAKIARCRAALILTPNERTNLETALAIRQINPHIRLIIRSTQTHLNSLLSERLGNFAAYDPTALPVRAFALAAVGTTIIGSFPLAGKRLQVIRTQVTADSPWLKLPDASTFNTDRRRLLVHIDEAQPLPLSFDRWLPSRLIQVGDVLVYVEIVDPQTIERMENLPAAHRIDRWRVSWQVWNERVFHQFDRLGWQSQVRRVAIAYGLSVAILLAIGTCLFHAYYPGVSWLAAFFDTAILLLGGYGDLFGNFHQLEPIPWWLRAFALGLTIVGTAFVGVLYAILTQALLASKFQFIQPRPPLPQQGHVAIVGAGTIARQVAELLRELRQPLVGITLGAAVGADFLPQLPIVTTNNLHAALTQANCATARSVAIVTADEMLNLEIALTIRSIDPELPLVVRTAGGSLRQLLPQILTHASILDLNSVAAAAFAGAAFGEQIIDLFRWGDRTVLVAEYQIEPLDTLNGLLLADLAYGYGAMPILHQRANAAPTLLPADNIQLHIGDRAIVLATIDALRRIEQGRLSIKPKNWRLRIDSPISSAALSEIARVIGCPPEAIATATQSIPATIPIPLYEHQAQILVATLDRLQVRATAGATEG